jgi:hypothetical protein
VLGQRGVAHRQRRARYLRVLIGEAALAPDCPDDSELAGYLDRALTGPRTRVLEAHFDRCRFCRELVFMLAGLDPEKTT